MGPEEIMMATPTIEDLLHDAPSNWRKRKTRGAVDSLNDLNMRDAAGLAAPNEIGSPFSPQRIVANPKVDPVRPARTLAVPMTFRIESIGVNTRAPRFPRGLRYFDEKEANVIPNVAPTAIAKEVATDPLLGLVPPLNCALMRNLGMAMTTIREFRKFAAGCVAHGWSPLLPVAASLKFHRTSGALGNRAVTQ
jgi:hypothetical protein